MSSPPFSLRVGTRTSTLARRQTDTVIHALALAWPGLACEVIPFVTEGDRALDRPLPEIGGKGLFTHILEQALRDHAIDIAVHSLKDLPTEDRPGLSIAATLPREDARDAIISRTGVGLEAVPARATVGTSSLRRMAQVRALRPDAQVLPLRGNVDTRVRKALDANGPYDAVILAAAGLRRLGLDRHVTAWLPLDAFLPAPGQGALAVQCRADDRRTRDLLAPLHDPDTWSAVAAERAFLAALDAGCSAPVAAWGRIEQPDGAGDVLYLDGLVATGDGVTVIRVSGSGDPRHPEKLGVELAQQALERGARSILASIRAR